MTMTRAVTGVPQAIRGWVARGPVAAGALWGMALAASVCAAVWFIAGTPKATAIGGCVLAGSYLLAVASRRSGALHPAPGDNGWSSVPGTTAGDDRWWQAGPRQPAGAGQRSQAWAGAPAAAAAEFAVYGCLAAGAPAARQPAAWVLAAGAMTLLVLREVTVGCRALDRPGHPARPGPAGRVGAALGGQILLIAVITPVWGVQVAFAVVLGWGLAMLGWELLRPGAGFLRPVWQAGGQAMRAAMAALIACRDDGPLARRVGHLVRGQLVPLPPALAGLAAILLLAAAGMGDLPGILLLTPAVAMLLAAPGAGHPHDGRADWLVPAVLVASQCAYIIALGFAAGVPAPLTFALASVTGLRHLQLISGCQRWAGSPSWPMGMPADQRGLGWDGRMLVAGLAALAGLTTFAYLALTAYLGWLLGSSGRWNRLAVSEEER